MNSLYWFFPIAALINAVTSTVFSIYLIFGGFKNKVARFLFFFCFSVAAWSYCYFFWQISKDANSALLWARLLMFGAIFTSTSYFHLVLVFLQLDKEKFYKFVLAIFYFFSLVWVVANFTPYFVSHVVAISYFKFWPMAGPFYLPFLISFGIHVIYASSLLLKKFFRSKGEEKIQAGLMLLGIFLAFVGGSTNYPLWYGINFPPWGNILVGIYVVLTVYAMMKYKFLNIKVVSSELFTGLVFVIFLIDVFLSKSVAELTFRIVGLIFMIIFGAILIRSIHREIQRREEVTNLAHSLEKANLRLQELDRQKTDFLSIASHQLRTPLSILKGYIELIKDGGYGKPTKGIVETLDNMDSSNEHLIKLVDEFLNISRIEQGRTKFVFKTDDVFAVIEDVKKELYLRAKDKKIELVSSKRGIVPPVEMDAEKVRHVIFNFIDNAIKYSGAGKIATSLEAEDNGVTVRVCDKGFGFNKVDEANFFQKFYRGENVKGTNVTGTGLGLYVCRKFIEAHGGKVWAHSPGLGKGSEFGFWLPLKVVASSANS